MKGHPLVNKQLKKFQDRKTELLKMKKSEHGNELNECNAGIQRMKRWNREIERAERQKQVKKSSQEMAKACEKTVKAIKGMSEALGKVQSKEKPRGVNPVIYK